MNWKLLMKPLPYIASAVIGVALSPDLAFATTGLQAVDTTTNNVFKSMQGFGGPLMMGGGVGTIVGAIKKSPWMWGGVTAAGAGAALGGLDQVIGVFSPTGAQSVGFSDLAAIAASTGGWF